MPILVAMKHPVLPMPALLCKISYLVNSAEVKVEQHNFSKKIQQRNLLTGKRPNMSKIRRVKPPLDVSPLRS